MSSVTKTSRCSVLIRSSNNRASSSALHQTFIYRDDHVLFLDFRGIFLSCTWTKYQFLGSSTFLRWWNIYRGSVNLIFFCVCQSEATCWEVGQRCVSDWFTETALWISGAAILDCVVRVVEVRLTTNLTSSKWKCRLGTHKSCITNHLSDGCWDKLADVSMLTDVDCWCRGHLIGLFQGQYNTDY